MMSDGHVYLTGFGGQPHASFVPHFFFSSPTPTSSLYALSRR
jgi:hypothetical protein